MNHIHPTSATMSMKPIQSPYAPMEPREDSDHHHVVPWTLKCTRWIWTTEKLITTELLYSWKLQIYQLPNIFFFRYIVIYISVAKKISLGVYSYKYIIRQNFVLFGYIVMKKLKSRLGPWERITKNFEI